MVLPSAPVEDGDTVSYTYDNSGALAKVTDSATGITTTYYYDFTDRLLRYEEESSTLSHTVGYGYDTINNLTSLVETINGVTHTTSYEYDDDNRITKVLNGDTTKAYTYDAYSRVSVRGTSHGGEMVLRDVFTYLDPSDTTTTSQLASHRIQTSDSDSLYQYTYDDNGNILSISGSLVQRSLPSEISYVYDTANQLVRENNSVANKTWTWTYDNAGNILSRTEYAYTTGELGTPVDTVTYTYGDDEWGDLLTGYDGQTITSDTIGNMLSDGTWTYTWEHGRQLASMTDGTTTWNYTYNSSGLRTSRTNGTTTYNYIYNGSQLTQMTVTTVDGEETTTDTLYFTYDASGIPMTVTYNDVVYYYVTNIQGDVIAILDSTGATVVEYTYDAWGNPLDTTSETASTLATRNPLLYRGYVYDTETRLYYLQSRYYNPELGRFINADTCISTGQGLLGQNMFAYCGNNPVSRVDPTGDRYTSTEIHNAVLDDICSKHSSMTRHDTYMKYKKRYCLRTYGWCDLYDTQTGEVWEAKRFGGGSSCTRGAAKMQLKNYVENGVLKADPSLELKTGGTFTTIEANVFKLPDKDGEGAYLVGYWDAGDGIIFYDYAYVPSQEEIVDAALWTLVAVAYLGLAFATGGSSLPFPAPSPLPA